MIRCGTITALALAALTLAACEQAPGEEVVAAPEDAVAPDGPLDDAIHADDLPPDDAIPAEEEVPEDFASPPTDPGH